MGSVCTPTGVQKVHFWQEDKGGLGGVSETSQKGQNEQKVTESEVYPLYTLGGLRLGQLWTLLTSQGPGPPFPVLRRNGRNTRVLACF